ncbi:MAG: hypothetical protein MHM6MM_000732 [Cercozoa sp. M6MM]
MSFPHWRKLFFLNQPSFQDGSVILITGASSGIGREIALRYAERDCSLVLAARTKAKLEQVADACREKGRSVTCVSCDVREEKQCKRLIERTLEEYGRLDILVLNAGVGSHVRFHSETDLSVFEHVMRTNFLGYVHCTKHALEPLKRTHGQIVVLSSISGEIGLPFRTAYCASKFAVTGFFEALRAELTVEYEKQHGKDSSKGGKGDRTKEGRRRRTPIDITIVCPPTVNTNLREHSKQFSDSNIGSENDKEGNKEAMSVADCASIVIEAADRRLRKVFFPIRIYASAYLRPFWPDFVDYFVNRAAASL